MKKNQGDNIDVDLYLGLYEKLVDAGTSGCAFIGNDYHYADQLFQWGFVQIMMTPIRKDGVCRGNVVRFIHWFPQRKYLDRQRRVMKGFKQWYVRMAVLPEYATAHIRE